MSEREKLIKLLEIALPKHSSRGLIEGIADHLLENGVIVPPFRCGDRVWFVLEGLGEVCEAIVIKYEYNYFTSPQEWLTIEYISDFVGKHEYESRIDLMLGKTVFLSREDAEKALRKEDKSK